MRKRETEEHKKVVRKRIVDKYYNLRKERIFKSQKERYERNRKIIEEAKNVPCADCGKSFPTYIMDFDHVRGIKELRIASDSGTISVKRLIKEIEKCDIVCANCHRERTYGDNKNSLILKRTSL